MGEGDMAYFHVWYYLEIDNGGGGGGAPPIKE